MSIFRSCLKFSHGSFSWTSKLSRTQGLVKSRNVHQCVSSVLTRCCCIRKPLHYVNRNFNCRILHCSKAIQKQTDGDKDLVNLLQEEIAFEKENVIEVPKFRDFKVEMVGTFVTLTHKFNGERVEVCFDVNDNLNVDEGGVIDENSQEEGEETTSDIISYPNFSVKIIKPSGKTLQFNCTCNTGLNEDDAEGESEEDEQFDLFRFDNVKIYNENETAKAYEAETENMDGELYSMLMTTLLERGVTGTFVNNLLDLSTSVEHRHYLTFLKSLQEFMAGK